MISTSSRMAQCSVVGASFSNPRKILISFSHVHWCSPRHNSQHLSRKDSSSLRQALRYSRRSPLLQLHRERAATHRPFLVRLVKLFLHPLDRTYDSGRSSHHGHLFHIPRCLQLPGRHLPPLRELSIGGSILLSKHARRSLPSRYISHVSSHDICWSVELSGWGWCFAHDCALGFGLLGSEDQSKKQIRQRELLSAPKHF